MVQSLTKSCIFAAALLASAHAHGSGMHKVCPMTLESHGFHADGEKTIQGGSDITDAGRINDLTLNDLAMARPSLITVCADTERIHGIQLFLKVHHLGETLKEGQEKEMREDQWWDGVDALKPEHAGKVYPMNIIGGRFGDCYDLPIEDEDRLVNISFESDGEMLRILTVTLDSGKGERFGNFQGPWNDKIEQSQKFDKVQTLIGFHGHQAPDCSTCDAQHIVSLGYYTNQCPIDDFYEWETKFHAQNLDAEHALYAAERAISENEGTVIGVVIVWVIVGIVVLVLLYFVLKNRGAIFGAQASKERADQAGQGQHEAVPNDSIQEAPPGQTDKVVIGESENQA